MRHTVAVFLLLLAGLVGAPSARAEPARPIPAASRVLLVSIDGLRTDALLRAEAPVLRGLMKSGSFSMWAMTTPAAVTLPSHASMLTGVSPKKHGVTWNRDLPAGRGAYPKWPTLFEVAHGAGYTTAMAAGKSKFVIFTKTETLTWSFVTSQTVGTDREVAQTAIGWIDTSAPQVLFVHLPSVDSVGHEKGWGSEDQLRAIAEADGWVGAMLDALRRRGVADSTIVLVTADHGGAGESHGPGDPRSLVIPWILSGPGVRAGLDIATIRGRPIATEDTFTTLAYILGLDLKRPVDGQVVREAFSSSGPR